MTAPAACRRRAAPQHGPRHVAGAPSGAEEPGVARHAAHGGGVVVVDLAPQRASAPRAASGRLHVALGVRQVRTRGRRRCTRRRQRGRPALSRARRRPPRATRPRTMKPRSLYRAAVRGGSTSGAAALAADDGVGAGVSLVQRQVGGQAARVRQQVAHADVGAIGQVPGRHPAPHRRRRGRADASPTRCVATSPVRQHLGQRREVEDRVVRRTPHATRPQTPRRRRSRGHGRQAVCAVGRRRAARQRAEPRRGPATGLAGVSGQHRSGRARACAEGATLQRGEIGRRPARAAASCCRRSRASRRRSPSRAPRRHGAPPRRR